MHDLLLNEPFVTPVPHRSNMSTSVSQTAVQAGDRNDGPPRLDLPVPVRFPSLDLRQVDPFVGTFDPAEPA